MAMVAYGLVLALAALCSWLLWRVRQAEAGAAQRGTAIERAQERDRAAADERRRIFQDIHDDIGIKLLSLLHELQDERQADQVRSVMQDLRDVVSRAHRAGGPLLQVLGQIREEAERRLEVLGVTLLWQVDADVPNPKLNEAQALHLHRITREVISNAIRHAQAHTQVVLLDYTDDGPGRDVGCTESTGSESLRDRAQALGGDIRFTVGTSGGAKIVLQFPLPETTGDIPLSGG
jgi:signal transduction histidine kinase